MILRAWKRRERGYMVWLDDVEVSRRCHWLNTRTGVVRVFVLNEQGRKQVRWDANGNPAAVTEELHGRVRVERLPKRRTA
jgi:hypothetical protein